MNPLQFQQEEELVKQVESEDVSSNFSQLRPTAVIRDGSLTVSAAL